MKPTFLKLLVAVAIVTLAAVTPTVSHAQTFGTGAQPTVQQFPVYYPGYYPVYGWNPYWHYPYAVYPNYYYGLPPAYTTYWVPAYNLPPYQQRAYTYWVRSAYVPYYRYYSAYQPSYYYYIGY